MSHTSCTDYGLQFNTPDRVSGSPSMLSQNVVNRSRCNVHLSDWTIYFLHTRMPSIDAQTSTILTGWPACACIAQNGVLSYLVLRLRNGQQYVPGATLRLFIDSIHDSYLNFD